METVQNLLYNKLFNVWKQITTDTEELEKRRSDVDFIIVNGENSASGKGLRTKEYEDGKNN